MDNQQYHLDQKFLLACQQNDLFGAQLLLEQGADVHAAEESALWMAACHGNQKNLLWVVQHGGDVHGGGERSLHGAIIHGQIGAVRLLIQHGARFCRLPGSGLTLAAQHGHLPIVKLLVYLGASLDDHGKEALDHAIMEDQLPVVQYLIEQGVPFEMTPKTLELYSDFKSIEWLGQVQKSKEEHQKLSDLFSGTPTLPRPPFQRM